MAKRTPRPTRHDPDHNPQLTRRMASLGFRLEGMGGNQTAYRKADPTIGEAVVSTGDGFAPLRMAEPVSLHFFGTEHSSPLVELRFRSVTALLAALRPARRVAR